MVDIQYKMEANRLLMGHPQSAYNATELVALCFMCSCLITLRLKISEKQFNFKYRCMFLFNKDTSVLAVLNHEAFLFYFKNPTA